MTRRSIPSQDRPAKAATRPASWPTPEVMRERSRPWNAAEVPPVRSRHPGQRDEGDRHALPGHGPVGLGHQGGGLRPEQDLRVRPDRDLARRDEVGFRDAAGREQADRPFAGPHPGQRWQLHPAGELPGQHDEHDQRGNAGLEMVSAPPDPFIRMSPLIGPPYWALTQHSRHQPQSSGPHFAVVPKGEATVARTGRSRPETAPAPGGFRGAEPKGESARASTWR